MNFRDFLNESTLKYKGKKLSDWSGMINVVLKDANKIVKELGAKMGDDIPDGDANTTKAIIKDKEFIGWYDFFNGSLASFNYTEKELTDLLKK